MNMGSGKATIAAHPGTQLLDSLVCELVNRLEEGRQVDLADLAGGNEEALQQLEQLLPTLEAMVDLGHSVAMASTSGSQCPSPNAQTPASPSPLAAPDNYTLGDFRILREVGRGGMGVVYEAEQISLGRRVALKVLPFAAVLDQRNLDRFKNEARAAAALRHPHIVSVYAVGCERSVHFYAMEYIDGQSLNEVISQCCSAIDPGDDVTESQHGAAVETQSIAGLITSRRDGRMEHYHAAAKLAEQAARALHYAHQLGIVHRDVKPSNLLLDATGSLWITDFGLAMMQGDAALTMSGDLLGTLRYMSPEQAQARRGVVDHRTDIYSLGITLYELLALRPAFDAVDHQSLLRQLAEQEPPMLRNQFADLPHDLETVVVKATSKQPHDRYATAEEFADDLRRFLEHKPVLAQRPTRWRRFTSWVKRNPKAAALIAVIAALLTCLAIGGPLVAVQQTQLAVRVQDQLYDRDMKIAQEALAQGEFDRVDRILGEHIPDRAGTIDRRDFEWHYLYANSRRGLNTITFDHWVKVHDAELSPDGRNVAVAHWDGALKVYDVRSQKTVWKTTRNSEDGHTNIITDLTYSADGRLIATSSVDKTAVIWNAGAGDRIAQLGPFSSGVSNVAFSTDGAQMAVAIYTESVGQEYATSLPVPVYLYDISIGGTRDEVTLDIRNKRELVGAAGRAVIAFSCDGKLLAAGCDDGQVRLWKLPEGKALPPLPSSGPSVLSVAFSPTDPHLLACGTGTFELGWLGGDVRLWNVDDQQLIRVLSGHTAGVRRVTFSRDGKRLGTASADRTAKIWDLQSYKLIDTFRGHAATVTGITFSPDADRVASGSFDNTVRVWDVAANTRPAKVAAHFRAVGEIAFSPDDRMLATCGQDGTVRIWETASGELIRELDLGVPTVASVEFSPDGETLLAAGGYYPGWDAPGGISLWDVGSGRQMTSIPVEPNASCWSADFSPQGDRFVAAVQGNLEFYDTADGRVRMRLHHSDSPSRRVRWSPDGNFVVSVGGGGAAKSVKVWDAHTGECLQTIIPGDGDPLLSVAISPDSKTIAVQGKQFEITLCDIASGKCIGILPGHTDLIFDLDWHPDGRRLVSVSTDNTCRIWNVQTGAELLTFRDAPSWVLSARFSHDGSLLVTGDANSLWGRMAPIRFYDATLPDIANESQR